MAKPNHKNSKNLKNQPPKAPKLPNTHQGQEAADHYFTGSVGQTLRKRREEYGIGLEAVSAETKIQTRYLQAIERSAWNQLPHTVHALGFVRQYARALGLDGEVAATKYLLERGPLATATTRPQTRRVQRAIVGTRVLIGGIIAIVAIGVIGYLIIQLSVLAAPPNLDVTDPPGDTRINRNTFEIKGSTTPAASVSVNGSVITVGDDGKFSTNVSLQDGLNTVRVESTNRAGKTSKVERNILVER